MLKSLRIQLLIMALMPPFFLAIILGVYLSYSHWLDLQEIITNKGNTLTQQLSLNSEDALLNNNISSLQKLGNISLEDSGVRACAFYNSHGKQLTHSGASFKIAPNVSSLAKVLPKKQLTRTKQYSLFIIPIFQAAFTSQITNNQSTNPLLLGWIALEYDHNHIVISQLNNIFIESIIIFCILMFTIFITVLLSRRLTHDLFTINDKLKSLKEGNLINFEDIQSCHELKHVCNGISELSNQLKNDIILLEQELDILKNDFESNYSNYEAQNIQLQLAIKDAKSANDTKSEFLSNTSHEIRTPLNGIIGFTRLLKNTKLNAQQTDYLSTIEKSSENLLSIINDILDFSKIEAGKLELEITTFNVQHLMEECLNLFAPQAFDKKLEMVLVIYPDVPLLVNGDQLRLKQVISNLLNNAVKFTSSGTISLQISLEHEDENNIELEISVSDTGIGMGTEQQRTIFEPFTQANTSISREYGGTGLGLAIVKKLIELMHDEIKVDSEINKGSTFHFKLKTTKVKQNPSLDSNLIDGKSILLIENHYLQNLSIKNTLTEFKCRVFTAGNYEEAKSIFTDFHIDLTLYSFSHQNDADQQNNDINLFTKENHPLLLLVAAQYENLIKISRKKNISILYKPMKKIDLYKKILNITHPTLHDNYPNITNTTIPNPTLRLLIVDDNEANIKLILALLSDTSHIIHTAKNGEESIKICNEHAFDIIFMDIQMPVLNGIDATKYIRQFSTLNNSTPIIAITAHAMADEKTAIFNAGMNEYITKPISLEQTLSAIEKYSPKNQQKNVDINLCLKLSNYKSTLAIELYNMLISTLKNDVQNIKNAFSNNDINNLLSEVHKLHGACCYTGTPILKECAQRLEYAIKNNNSHEYESLLMNLESASNKVLDWNDKNNIINLLASPNHS